MSAPKFTSFGVPGYRATPDGQVWSFVRRSGPRALKPSPNDDGYPCVRIRGKSMRVHRIMASAFLSPQPSPAHEIRHLDGNPLNNDLGNLAWGTRQDNADDRARHGRTSNGWKHGAVDPVKHAANSSAGRCARSRLSDDDVLAAIRARADGKGVVALAREYGVTHQYMSRILLGKRRQHSRARGASAQQQDGGA